MDNNIEQQLEVLIKEVKKLRPGYARSIVNGVLYGAGSILGVAVMLTLITFFIKESDYFQSTRNFLTNTQSQLEKFNASLGNFNKFNR